MTSESDVAKAFKQGNIIPDHCIDVRRYLMRVYPSFYNRFSGYCASGNIGDLFEMQNWCETIGVGLNIDFEAFRPMLIQYLNCKHGDIEKEEETKVIPFLKKRQNMKRKKINRSHKDPSERYGIR